MAGIDKKSATSLAQVVIAIAVAAIAFIGGQFIMGQVTKLTTCYASDGWRMCYGNEADPKQDDQGHYYFDWYGPNVMANYLVYPVNNLANAKSLSLTYRLEKLSGDPKLLAMDCSTAVKPGRVALFFQRRGDNLSGQGEYSSYRFFAVRGGYWEDMQFGTRTLTVPLTPESGAWTGVINTTAQTHPQEFEAAKADAAQVGMTFGGCSAGHGVRVEGGTARFTILGYRID